MTAAVIIFRLIFRTQRIFAAVQPVSGGLAVIRIHSSLGMIFNMSSTSAPVLWSHQIIEGRITSPASSNMTRPCICPEIPIPFTASLSTPDCETTSFMVLRTASLQSSGFCSAQPFPADTVDIPVKRKRSRFPFHQTGPSLLRKFPHLFPRDNS